MTIEQLRNKRINDQEYSSRETHLESGPTNIILCTTYKCNMKCIFCLGRGADPDFDYEIYKNIFEKKMGLFLRKADQICFTGWGEFLLWPEIINFLDYLNKEMPDANKTFTTNGLSLTEEVIHRILVSRYTIQISLHTSNPLTHKMLTQSGCFEQIIMHLDKLIELRKQRDLESRLWIALVFLITSLNIENLPDFVKFAGMRGINSVICNYITIFQPEQLGLTCFFLPETTNRMFDEAQKAVRKYDMDLSLPPKFGAKKAIQQPGVCEEPWKTVFIDALGNVLTCCYAGEPIGNLNTDDFESIWNGKEYRELRSALIEGRPHIRCKNCFKFLPMNVDDIRSHITFRNEKNKEDIFRVLELEK